MSESDPDKLKVVELRDALAGYGLDTKGNKPVLVKRLKDHLGGKISTSAGFKAVGPAEYDPTDPTEDTDPPTEFGDKNFVHVNNRGLSFKLSAPKPAKPAPPPLQRSASPAAELEPSSGKRSGAAAFFLSEVERLNKKEQKEAKVPLPPSFGYQVDEDDDEEEDGPPGMVPLKLPAIKFDKPFTKDIPKDNVESWKRVEMPDLYSQRKKISEWREGVVLQDPGLFLQEEAGRQGIELITEVEHTDVPGLSLENVKMKVSYNYLTSRSQAKSRREAMDQCAIKILKDAGPWLDPELLKTTSQGLENVLPKSCRSWLPPKYNVKHVRLEQKDNLKQTKRLYEMTISLGPFTCSAIGDSVEESLQYTNLNIKSFIKNRDLSGLRPPHREEGRLTYTTGLGIVRVVMEKGREQLLPPLDLFILQDVLQAGRFPPSYCSVDQFGCSKIFYCDVCGHRMTGADNLIQHVQGERHNNRLGKFTYKGNVIETFRSSADPQYDKKIRKLKESEKEKEKYVLRLCSSCEEEGKVQQATSKCKDCNDYMCESCREAHKNTRLTKNHEVVEVAPPTLHHPVQDEEAGRRRREDENYLISVYRCPTRIQVKPDQPHGQQEEYAGDVYEGEEYLDEGGLGPGSYEGYEGYQDYQGYEGYEGYEGFRRKKLWIFSLIRYLRIFM